MRNVQRMGLMLLTQVLVLGAYAQVRMPRLFSDNMVLQRDRPVHIWGWAHAGEKITVRLAGQQVKTTTARDGSWSLNLAPLAAGGPYDLTVTGKNTLTFRNVLMGDVWLCSGQSNMEWPLKLARDAAHEIADANHPSIRLFAVKHATAFTPQQDVAGGEWQECSPATAADFSAVAYFFGRRINGDEHVPIGLVSSTWNGTNIQAWTSWDLMQKDPAWQKTDLKEVEKNKADMERRIEAFRNELVHDKGEAGSWFAPVTDTADWKPMDLPRLWETTAVGNADGVIWFRKDIELPAGWEGRGATLSLGPIDDSDVTYVNGRPVGSTNAYDANRIYTVGPGLLHTGRNTVVVKVVDNGGGGGIYGDAAQLFLEGGGQKIPLAGRWRYRPSALTTDFGIKDFGPNGFPAQLFNAMIAPVVPFAIKGVIWYQGESNADEAYKYRSLFPQMITDWRRRWGYEFPFLWAQLANYMKPSDAPVTTPWAELREAQNRALSLPATGQAVLIDLGEEKELHPHNKQDVGSRLALAAEKVAYGRSLVYSGPVFKSMEVKEHVAVLAFEQIGSGLVAHDRYGYVRGFAIAGPDRKFHWATATIAGDRVIVHSSEVKDPVAVRYAWGDNPDDANLYNREGLPASPFRTDDWKGITEK